MGKNKQVIDRGDLVKCMITGLEGIVTLHETNLQGQARFDVQPGLGKDGKIRQGYMIDGDSLAVVEKNKTKALAPEPFNNCSLGDEVEDTVTGFRGVAVTEGLSINGCTRFFIQPKVDEKNKLPEGKGFDVGRLKRVKAAAAKEGQRRTGGPMTKSGAW